MRTMLGRWVRPLGELRVCRWCGPPCHPRARLYVPYQYEPGDGSRCDVKPVVEAGSVEGGIQHPRHQGHCPAAGEHSRLIHFFAVMLCSAALAWLGGMPEYADGVSGCLCVDRALSGRRNTIRLWMI